MDHEELLSREMTSWAAFESAAGKVSPDRREAEGVVPGWSVKDLMWHCAYWASFAADTIEARAAGDMSDPWDHDDEYWDIENDRVAKEGKEKSWDEVLTAATAMRVRARKALEAAPDSVAEQWFVEETFEHYDEHAAEVEAFAARG